jgi:hypothetical protein
MRLRLPRRSADRKSAPFAYPMLCGGEQPESGGSVFARRRYPVRFPEIARILNAAPIRSR